jgi:sterol desaturase/sphingolipid hydroxylase (fatty acid hydroxylase superfamily)
MVYSLGFKIIIVILIGASIKGILLFEIILNSMAMFNHANIKIPPKIEKYLRYIIVTPQMHIIHHSVEKSESDTNFGFNFSFWDYWFKTYTPQFKSDGVIGQKEYNKNLDQRLTTLLTQPFRKI